MAEVRPDIDVTAVGDGCSPPTYTNRMSIWVPEFLSCWIESATQRGLERRNRSILACPRVAEANGLAATFLSLMNLWSVSVISHRNTWERPW